MVLSRSFVGAASPTDGQFRRLIMAAPDVVAILEADLTVRFVSRSIRETLGFSSEEVQGSNLKEYAEPGAFEGALSELDDLVEDPNGEISKTFEARLRHKNGTWRCFDATMIDLLEDQGFRGMACYLRDVTERRAQEEKLAHQAMHDGLTGLPNRALFLNRLSRALGAAAREGEPVAVLFLDLDDFKAINDTLGHEAGDRLLVAFGRRVRDCLRPGDTIARLGGDEFAVLIEEAAQDAERVASRINEAMQEPLDLDGQDGARVRASVGVVIASQVRADDRPEDLLRAADEAMYRAKRSRARHGVGDLRASRATARPSVEERLRRAVEYEELGLHYQAAASPGNRRIVCMEALLRWEDPELGNLPPQEIIGLAERSDLIDALERWIFWRACRQCVAWREMWPSDPPLISVNVSTGQFRRGSLFGAVDATLRETGLDPSALVLEISEEALLNGDGERGTEKLGRLKTLGVKLAIDDFAPGNMELPALELLPVDFLKLERSLVSELGRDRKNAGLLASLYTAIAQARDIGVVAEGVENIEQLEAVEEMDCDLVQGFYLWRPLPASRATELLATNLGPRG